MPICQYLNLIWSSIKSAEMRTPQCAPSESPVCWWGVWRWMWPPETPSRPCRSCWWELQRPRSPPAPRTARTPAQATLCISGSDYDVTWEQFLTHCTFMGRRLALGMNWKPWMVEQVKNSLIDSRALFMLRIFYLGVMSYLYACLEQTVEQVLLVGVVMFSSENRRKKPITCFT